MNKLLSVFYYYFLDRLLQSLRSSGLRIQSWQETQYWGIPLIVFRVIISVDIPGFFLDVSVKRMISLVQLVRSALGSGGIAHF